MKKLLEGIYQISEEGARTYLLQTRSGNILIDTPSLLEDSVNAVRTLGGAKILFITHRDAVGDACAWKEEFGVQIAMHTADAFYVVDCEVDRELEDMEWLTEETQLIHVPGHSSGNSALLFTGQDGILFGGDSVVEQDGRLSLPPDRFSTDPVEAADSVRRLLDYAFRAILPAHGEPILSGGKQAVELLVTKLREQARGPIESQSPIEEGVYCMWTTELRGRAVVSLQEAKKVGSVADVYFRPESGEIAGLSVSTGGLAAHLPGGAGDRKLVSESDVKAIGQDAVTIRDQSVLSRPEQMAELRQLPSADRVIGLKVVTEGGKLVGKVADIFLDPTARRVVNYRVRSSSGSPLQGFIGGSQQEMIIPFSGDIRIGDELMVVPDSAVSTPSVGEEDEPQAKSG
ncbi:MAG: hypothetical protein EPO21_15105 [Chloroflexota bacterium]|nr:MAG: hypothetical protein EPO21_15105 [Chloroflexota bacterium]